MQPAPSTRIPDGFLAAMRLEGEKPHQGLPSRNPAPNPVREVCKFTVLLGMRGQAELNRAGSCCTQHEHDTESGNDYFGARYYASSIGRFLSPDWSAKEEPVPYAKLDDPQTLNLYSFVGNNPLARADADGHCFPLCLAVAGGGALLADEAPLAATGPIGWTVIGATALGVGGYALYEHYHQDTPAPPATPAPTTSAAGQSTPASPQEPNRKDGGSKTEPNLPKKTVANEDGVEIKHFTRSGDHGPAHLHVEGGGESTKIGMNGKPLSGSPELSSTQQSVVNNNLSTIRSAVDKIQRWFGFNSK